MYKSKQQLLIYDNFIESVTALSNYAIDHASRQGFIYQEIYQIIFGAETNATI